MSRKTRQREKPLSLSNFTPVEFTRLSKEQHCFELRVDELPIRSKVWSPSRFSLLVHKLYYLRDGSIRDGESVRYPGIAEVLLCVQARDAEMHLAVEKQAHKLGTWTSHVTFCCSVCWTFTDLYDIVECYRVFSSSPVKHGIANYVGDHLENLVAHCITRFVNLHGKILQIWATLQTKHNALTAEKNFLCKLNFNKTEDL